MYAVAGKLNSYYLHVVLKLSAMLKKYYMYTFLKLDCFRTGAHDGVKHDIHITRVYEVIHWAV